MLVEFHNKFGYTGPQVFPSSLPVINEGSLEFRDIGDTPACLNKTKLWIERDVFLALEKMAVPPDPVKEGKRKNADDKAAVRRAMGGNQ